MTWKALDSLDEALSQTKNILLPFDKNTWAKLALLAIFTGGGLGFPGFPSEGGSSMEEQNEISDMVGEQNLSGPTGAFSNTAISLIAVSVILVVAVIAYVSSVLEFVYYKSLIDQEVSLSDNFKYFARDGASYLLLRLLSGGLMLAILAGGFAAYHYSKVLLPLIVVLALFLLIAQLVALGLVNNLVLPEMIKARVGILEAIKRVWSSVKAQPRQVIVYIFVRLVARTGAGMVILFGMLFALLPTAVLVWIIVLIGASSQILALVIALPVLLFFLVFIIGVMVPPSVFMVNYALAFHERL